MTFGELLIGNILPYWSGRMVDRLHGGFHGRIDGDDVLHGQANKGAVLNARILWTFSAAYRALGTPEYRGLADRAYAYVNDHFVDSAQGGVFWELDYRGRPVNRKKQVYAQAFAIYAWAEYHRATGNPESLQSAKELFLLLEGTADRGQGGYLEAFSANWQPIADMRLSAKDANEKKTMNTHLHVLEAYTNLYRVWRDERLRRALEGLLTLFSVHFLADGAGHLTLFFDEQWRPRSTAISYGHDIEAAWLLLEAAEVLGDGTWVDRMGATACRIAEATLAGIQPDGSLAYERDGGHLDDERHWWVQAEAVVGFTYAFRQSGDGRFQQAARKLWHYILANLVDTANGEWHWSRRADGSINRTEDKAGFWKCPYHNARMCLEMAGTFGVDR